MKWRDELGYLLVQDGVHKCQTGAEVQDVGKGTVLQWTIIVMTQDDDGRVQAH